jgi:hypothetical protein
LYIVFNHGQYILILCAQAVQLRNGTSELSLSAGLSGPPNFIERWKMLFDCLSDWYNNRPREFRPMLELPSTPQTDPVDLFPLILFTNSAGIFINQLFHTAILLLLQQKPRTLKLMDHRSVLISPLWHIHRICGIALNNDRRECWDLSLLASLFLAAREMTHEAQHKAIEQGLLRIQKLTGWDVQHLLTKLHDSWRLAEGN